MSHVDLREAWEWGFFWGLVAGAGLTVLFVGWLS